MPVAEQVYLDTSALIKRYVPEQNSDRFDAYFADQVELTALAISRLTFVEVRSTLARKRRESRLNIEQENAALQALRSDIQDGILSVHPMSDVHFVSAFHLLDDLPTLPLRTLDALHLCVAQAMGAKEIATADDVMRRVAETLGLNVAYFGNKN
jgi:hypothetical protein